MTNSTLESKDLFLQEAFEYILYRSQKAVKTRGFFSLALSGGSTPLPLFRLMARSDLFPFEKTFFFWADERAADFESSENNSGQACRILMHARGFNNLLNLPDFKKQVFIPDFAKIDKTAPPEDIYKTCEKVSLAYEIEIRNFLDCKNLKAFDMILLGMGDDYHIASIFADSPLLNMPDKIVSPVISPDYYTTKHRISLTMNFINSCREKLFLMSGLSKKRAYNKISFLMESEQKTSAYPVTFVSGARKIFFIK
jgi:6-phosphogluconolactonase